MIEVFLLHYQKPVLYEILHGDIRKINYSSYKVIRLVYVQLRSGSLSEVCSVQKPTK